MTLRIPNNIRFRPALKVPDFAPVVNVAAPVVQNIVRPADVQVDVAAPDVTVAAPDVTVAAPDVDVAAPDVTVNVPDNQDITITGIVHTRETIVPPLGDSLYFFYTDKTLTSWSSCLLPHLTAIDNLWIVPTLVQTSFRPKPEFESLDWERNSETDVIRQEEFVFPNKDGARLYTVRGSSTGVLRRSRVQHVIDGVAYRLFLLDGPSRFRWLLCRSYFALLDSQRSFSNSTWQVYSSVNSFNTRTGGINGLGSTYGLSDAQIAQLFDEYALNYTQLPTPHSGGFS